MANNNPLIYGTGLGAQVWAQVQASTPVGHAWSRPTEKVNLLKPCPKCGCNRITAQYLGVEDLLRQVCETCGFAKKVLPLDAGAVVEATYEAGPIPNQTRARFDIADYDRSKLGDDG